MTNFKTGTFEGLFHEIKKIKKTCEGPSEKCQKGMAHREKKATVYNNYISKNSQDFYLAYFFPCCSGQVATERSYGLLVLSGSGASKK